MFKSFDYEIWNQKNGGKVKLIDDDFEDWLENDPLLEKEIVKSYMQRGLNIGKNFARFTIYYAQVFGWRLERYVKWQDDHCPSFIEDWPEIAKDRDEYLRQLMIWL